MIKFDKPRNLNGSELVSELILAGIAIESQSIPVVDGNGDLWLEIDSKDEAKAKVVVDAHNGTTISPEPTIEQKLASVGLNLQDLKTALGL